MNDKGVTADDVRGELKDLALAADGKALPKSPSLKPSSTSLSTPNVGGNTSGNDEILRQGSHFQRGKERTISPQHEGGSE